MYQRLITKITQYLLPHTCILCGTSCHLIKDLCPACQQDLPWLKNCCKTCANPLPPNVQILQCGQCEQRLPFFTRTLALFHYEYPINSWILGLKFQHRLLYAKLLGELYAEYAKKIYMNQAFPEVIIPVPLHKKRLCERGFNQSLELAKHLQKALKIPIDNHSCQRIRYTETQSLISAKKRRNNVKNAFSCTTSFSKKHVALVDDVMTTGETLNALSKALREQGVTHIDVWCIARAAMTLT